MVKVNLDTEQLKDDILKTEDHGEGFVTIEFNRPLIHSYFTRTIVLLKKANPHLMITSMVVFPGCFDPKYPSTSMGVKEVWINFEEKMVCEQKSCPKDETHPGTRKFETS